MHFWQQAKSRKNGIISKIMVNVSVCGYEMSGRKLVVTNKLHNGTTLFWIECTTIYDDSFFSFIVNHIAVFLKWIDNKSLYIKHITIILH